MKIAEVVMVMTNTPKGLTNNRIAGKWITKIIEAMGKRNLKNPRIVTGKQIGRAHV